MKKSIYLIISVFCITQMAKAQVGIGTTAPDSQLDIRSSNQAAPANNDGILIPKVDVFPVTNPTAAQQSMLVYLTTATTFGGNPKPIGFYYWDNVSSDWIGISSAANGDHDWYEETTTSPPNAITDDMFHTGNVAIGKNTTDYPLEINGTGFNRTLNITTTNNVTDGLFNASFLNDYTGNSNDNVFVSRNTFSGTSLGNVIGNSVQLNASGSNPFFGSYNVIGNSSAGSHIAIQNSLGFSTVNNFGVRNLMQGITTNGTFTGISNELYNNTGNGTTIGVNNFLGTSGTNPVFGSSTSIFDSGDGAQIGNYATISNTGNGIHYGAQNILSGTGTGIHYGNHNILNGIGTGAQYGSYNSITNSSTGIHYGTFNTLSGTTVGQKYGIRNELSGNGNQTGSYNILTGTGTGLQIGSYNEITTTNASAHTGVLSTMSGSGAGLKTGIYSYILPAAGGTHYGVYSEVLKAGATNFAGYFLGNVGIGTTAGNMYTLPPSRGTNGQIMQTNGTGVVTWQNPGSIAWLTTGNAGTVGGNTTTAGTNFIGTTDNQNIDFRTNNTFRGRFSNLGEFFVGTLNTVLTGDLMNAVGNVTFPWASNGYTAFDGAGTYGQVTAGTTIFAGVQGEYNGTNAQGAGVRGLALTATAGTSFTAPHTGVSGGATTSGAYKFGTYGSGGASARSGGVLGNDFGVARGALGYYSSGLLDYSVYGFGIAYTNGVAAGRISNDFTEKNTNIGLGIYGGVMGGWVRGMKYGFHTKGETYSLYVDGNGYTNKPLAYLISTDGASKTASYMSSSMKPEVTVNGKANLENGKVFVAFDPSFQQIISNIDDVIITASPQGKSNGVYIDQITNEGFWIYENNEGTSNVKISWIAITKIKGEENPEVPKDLMTNDFDTKMDGVMFNENNTRESGQSLWWDGTQIRWDKPTNDKVDKETERLARPKEAKK